MSPAFRLRALLVLAAVAAAPPFAWAQTLNVAAASDLQFVMPALAARFEKDTGGAARVTFGSSGNFFTQIQNGAPFDVFMSADVSYPRKLEAAGLVDPGSVYTYATGRLVLWVRSDTGLDVSRGLALLADGAIKRIAIANPAHAPYGRAAVAAMEHAGVYSAVRDKIVFGENVSQAAQFAQSGNAGAALVARALAVAAPMKDTGRAYDVPPEFHPPIDQAAAIIRASKQQDLAARFMNYLKQPAARALLASYGFAPPSGGH
jgi:molybdate transport system substrate-binding protein